MRREAGELAAGIGRFVYAQGAAHTPLAQAA